MLIVLLTYEKPLDEIDRLMREHVRFLERGFHAGVFLAAGRRDPRTGGVILARGGDRDALDAVMREDPFVREGAASFEIVSFRTSLHAASFAPFADPGTRAVRDDQ